MMIFLTSRGLLPKWQVRITPPKINIEPENDGLEDVSPFPGFENLRFQPLIFRGVLRVWFLIHPEELKRALIAARLAGAPMDLIEQGVGNAVASTGISG